MTVMLHISSTVLAKNGSTARTNLIWHFHWIPTWGCVDPTIPTYCCPLGLLAFFLNWRSVAGRKFTRVQDLSKAVRHFRAQRYACFGVQICSSDVAEAARNVCCQWRDALWRGVEVWWRYVLHHLWQDFWVDRGSSHSNWTPMSKPTKSLFTFHIPFIDHAHLETFTLHQLCFKNTLKH